MIMRNYISLFTLMGMVALSAASCDNSRVYEKNVTIKKYIWDSAVKPAFEVEIRDTSVLYNLYVNVRHAGVYPYRNIWLLVGTRFPDSTLASKRIEVMLADEEGKWFGEGLGDIWDYRSLIQDNAYFSQPGTYLFTLEQNMRQDPLPGIMAVGIRIENTGIRRSGSK
jgi:gliding motility-associated lipoprotein GldH